MINYSSLSPLKTQRLLLRKLERSDIDSAAIIHGDPATNIHNPTGPRSRETTRVLLDDWAGSWERQRFGYWTVCSIDEPDQVLGFGGVMRKQIGDFSGLNLYFRFAAHTWGKGYATEMAMAALHASFVVLAEDAVYGLVRPANTPSRRTLEKIGMQLYSEVTDVPGEAASLIYRITRTDYLAAQP
ncbi:GNAT family N-acetyltransferase [Undibacterium sp.]|uniref:GNAT family N-acetyltransferase n=1 Tax=Undibacterium sp. TaxID=1914977 RepID=UPI002731BF4A|nr:GNAT family N-acetyltransferase [Undibacterium sp.]MDP1979508.1 GNAT family N-acetyltransferase [Undibacterium sp.]